MKFSDSITQLAIALVAAQADIPTIAKDASNPHFKSKFASLDGIIATLRPILAKHGLAVVQGASTPDRNEQGQIVAFCVETMLVHTSGEWITATVIMPLTKQSPQEAGSAMTYGRRYSLSALLALATDDDDDGNAASRPPKASPRQAKPPAQAKPTPTPSDPADRLVGGKRLGDLTTAKLEEVLAWAQEKGKADLETDIETLLEQRSQPDPFTDA